MYLLYLDESGDPNSWQTNDNFVLGGVAIHEGQVYSLTKQLDHIQQMFFPDVPMPIAFHATDIRKGSGRFRDLAQKSRDDLLDSVYDVINRNRFPNLVAFACDIHISAVTSASAALYEVFQDVCQRFNTFLVRQFNRGYKDKGMLVIDQAHQDRYRELIAQFQRSGTDWGYLGNVVDIPYFARSRETRLLQLADFCAYAVFRYYERSDDAYFSKILPRFDRRQPNHPPDGLKHIHRITCECAACIWR